MGVLISGLDAEACAALFAADWPHPQLRWTAPNDFLQHAETLEPSLPETLGSAGASERLLWLYQPPWALQVPDPLKGETAALAPGLAHWYRQQRTALALRRTLGERMLLVNAERVRGGELAAYLGLTMAHLGAANGAPTEGGQRPFSGATEQGLAKLFEWSLPHYWDLFEDLEAAAWLATGEPLFRRDLQPVSVEGIELLLLGLQQGLQWPQLRSEHEQSAQLAAGLQQGLREAETRLERERAVHAEMSERLTGRVTELEDRLEKREEELTATAAERDSLKTALGNDRAQLQELEQTIVETRSALEQAKRESAETEAAKAALETSRQAEATAAAARGQALLDDNQRLEAELHEIRDAYEGQMAANRDLRARLARSTETLDRARIQLCRQLARAGLSLPQS